MQILLHLPDELARRFKASVPPKQRSAFVAALLSKAFPEEDDALYRLALEVEKDQVLNTEMNDWETTIGDGVEAGK